MQVGTILIAFACPLCIGFAVVGADGMRATLSEAWQKLSCNSGLELVWGAAVNNIDGI